MDCKKIQDLLYDYVRNELDDSTSKFIKQHIKSCSDCKDELAYVKKYTKNMISFKDVPLPKGFIEDVEERIENPSLLKKIYRTLFYPLKIKLPMEAVGVIALSVIIFTLYKPYVPIKQSIEEPASQDHIAIMTQNEIKAKTGAAGDAVPGKMRDRRTSIIEKGNSDSPIQLAREEAEMTDSEITSDETISSISQNKPVAKEKMVNIVLTVKTGRAPKIASGYGGARYEAPQERLKKSKRMQSQIMLEEQNSQSGPSINRSDQAPQQPGSQYYSGVIQNYAPNNIKAIVAAYKGKIIKEDINKQTGSTNYLIVEIPDTKYSAFINRLNRLGNIQQDRVPSMKKRLNRNIMFNIRMKNSK